VVNITRDRVCEPVFVSIAKYLLFGILITILTHRGQQPTMPVIGFLAAFGIKKELLLDGMGRRKTTIPKPPAVSIATFRPT
jgi:hypothetical protein